MLIGASLLNKLRMRKKTVFSSSLSLKLISLLGNPIALMIHKLKLLENKVTLYLSDTFLIEDEENYDKPAEIVWIIYFMVSPNSFVDVFRLTLTSE
jgi:hypothetical protein